MDKKKNFSINDIVVSGILSYIAAICSLPSTGIVSTLPVAAICAIVASFISSSHILIYILFGLMPLLLNCLYGFDLSRALFFAVIGIITIFFAILFKKKSAEFLPRVFVTFFLKFPLFSFRILRS